MAKPYSLDSQLHTIQHSASMSSGPAAVFVAIERVNREMKVPLLDFLNADLQKRYKWGFGRAIHFENCTSSENKIKCTMESFISYLCI